MHTLRLIVFTFLLTGSLAANAMNGIFWQPQDRDLSISETRWMSLMDKVQEEGFDTLVVQWTRYGDSFNSAEDRAKLLKKVQSAHRAGLKLIIGLYSDPEFFNRQQQPPEALANYLNRLRALDTQQVKLWQEELGFEPAGWYMSAEIDDVNWRDVSVRLNMLEWLREIQASIKTESNQPVYISSFFTGNMSPNAYHVLLKEMQEIGVRVWIQDGGGVGTLTAAQRALYLDMALGCKGAGSSVVDGVVHEVFSVESNEQFSASPKPKAELVKLLKHKPICSKNQLYFSLRYLPISRGVLEYRLNDNK